MLKKEAKTQVLLKNVYINDVIDELMEELHVWHEDERVHYYCKPHVPKK